MAAIIVQFCLSLEGGSAVIISLYVSLVLLSFCAVVIAIDLTRRPFNARLSRDSSRSVAEDGAFSAKDMEGQ